MADQRRARVQEDVQDDRWAAGVLRPRPGGPAERFAARIGLRHPAAVFFAALFSAFAVLVAASIAVGFLATHVLINVGGLGTTDESAIHEIVKDRSSSLDTVSAIGSTVGGAPVLPILVGLVAIVCAFKRKWRIAAFAVFVLSIESATYRVSSLVVPRERPSVHRLEDLPADASYPSGHTAASIAVYAGLVLLLTSKLTDRRARIAAWAFAVLLPVLVATSRMYRGMHHPLDVASGVVIGIGAITVLLFACRAASCAQRSPAAERTPAQAGRARIA